jgi:hypothetical protein
METRYHYSSACLQLFSIHCSAVRSHSQFTAALVLQLDQIIVFVTTTEFLAQELSMIFIRLSNVLLLNSLRYKQEDRGFDSRGCDWNFSFT